MNQTAECSGVEFTDIVFDQIAVAVHDSGNTDTGNSDSHENW